MSFLMFADAAPSEAIQAHSLPGISVACLMIHNDERLIPELPIAKQYKSANIKTRDKMALRLRDWLREQRENGLKIIGFSNARSQRAAAEFGLSLIEELPDIRIEEHYSAYRLYFGQHHISLAQAVALAYYSLSLNFGILRAAKRIDPSHRDILVYLDRFPAASSGELKPGERSKITPGMHFMHYLRTMGETGIGIDSENAKMKLNFEMTTLEWWREGKKGKLRPGKKFPMFLIVDWFVASALAKEFPEEFVASYTASRKARDVAAALSDLHDEFKKFEIMSLADDKTLTMIRGATQQAKIPEAAREYILELAER